MNGLIELSWLSFGVSFVLSVFITKLTIFVFRRLNWVVDPKKVGHPAHIHKLPIPKGGGVPIVISISVVAIIFLKLDIHLIAVLAGLWLSLIIGLIDDIVGLNPYLRLLFNFLSAGVVVAAGIGIAYITNPLGGVIDLSLIRSSIFILGERKEIWWLSDIFALIWIPFIMNAINWSSGLDGQVSGVIVIAGVVVGILSLTFSTDITQWPVAVLAFALAGASAGFVLFHFYPQKIMPGYSGTTTAGFLLATLAILSTTKIGTALVVLGIPLIDAIYSIVRRLIKKKSPVWGDKGHLHHKLMDLGWGKRRIALFYWLITAILGAIALKTNAETKLFAILAVSVLMAGFFLWIYFSPFLRQLAQDNG